MSDCDVDQACSFEALGHDPPPNPPLPGFFTQSTHIELGVHATGNAVGVYGEGSSASGSSRITSRAVGVYGESLGSGPGDHHGVYGFAQVGNGVTGFSAHGACGIQGTQVNDGLGIAGLSVHRSNFPSTTPDVHPLPGTLGTGVGVAGLSGDGIGVLGKSMRSVNIDHLGPASDPADGDGTGVQGASLNGAGVRGMTSGGTGVVGESERGLGVVGTSKSDRGGRFASAEIAQINLTPLSEPLHLPCVGALGDVLVISQREPGKSQDMVASLWFCLKAGESEDHPAVWARVAIEGIASCATTQVPGPPQSYRPLEG